MSNFGQGTMRSIRNQYQFQTRKQGKRNQPGQCPSSENPNYMHLFQTHCNYDAGTWRDLCKFCGQESRSGRL